MSRKKLSIKACKGRATKAIDIYFDQFEQVEAITPLTLDYLRTRALADIANNEFDRALATLAVLLAKTGEWSQKE